MFALNVAASLLARSHSHAALLRVEDKAGPPIGRRRPTQRRTIAWLLSRHMCNQWHLNDPLHGSYAALLREDKADPRNAKILVTRAHSIDPSHPWLQVTQPACVRRRVCLVRLRGCLCKALMRVFVRVLARTCMSLNARVAVPSRGGQSPLPAGDHFLLVRGRV